ncbi:hypothetical protein [Neptuniibacter marinus]|uniref:hypothetical protein n=1 Tax=Neptuniibacter marinus TaxID=1806670 RepID=UPI003B5A3776
MDEQNYPEIDTGKAIASQQQAARLEAAFTEEQRRITSIVSRRLGRKDIIKMMTKLLTVTDLIDLQQLKDSKEYKGLMHIDENKKSQPITTWAEYCKVIEGRSVESIDNDLANLNTFGEEMFDAMRQVGIGPGKMRSIRKLPEDELLLIQQASESDDKDQVVELIDNLVTKHAKEKAQLAEEKEQLTSERDEAVADSEATRQVSAQKDEKINHLSTELEKSRRRISTSEPDQVAKELQIEAAGIAAEFKSIVQTKLRPAVEALMDYQTLHPEIDQQNWLSATISDLQLDLTNLADDYQLDELAQAQLPDFLNPEKVAAANAKVGAMRDERGI